MNISNNYKSLLKRIENKSEAVGTSPKSSIIVGASKYADVSMIREAYNAGLEVFAENRVQDFIRKRQELLDLKIKWHFIGHLQTNKVRKIVGEVELIHSIDSLRLAREVSKWAKAKDIIQSVLLQINVGSVKGKGGLNAKKSLQNAREIAMLEAIQVQGLMTIAPFTDEENVLREHFAKSAQLFRKVRDDLGEGFKFLSMGMSNDFELAIEYGANMLRLGSGVFK